MKLGLPCAPLKFKYYANNLTNPNSQATGGSITSELVSSVSLIEYSFQIYFLCNIEKNEGNN